MMTQLARPTSVFTIAVEFIRGDFRPWPIRIELAPVSRRQNRLGRELRPPNGAKTRRAGERAP
jgi:hypothetical protein